MTITVPIIATDGAQSVVTLPAPVVSAAGFGQPVMAAPAGYSNMIFHDTFSGTSLDLTKWSPSWGGNGILWNNFGKMGNDPNGFPYTGPNTPTSTEDQLFAASQVVVNNGLTITLKPNTAPLNPGGVHYQCVSGSIESVAMSGHGPGESANFVLPSTGRWHVQMRAKVPDMNHGMSPQLWFMPGHSGGNSNELDGVQGGLVTSNSNNYPICAQYFGPTKSPEGVPNVGVDATLAFHVYGVEVVWPNVINVYFDGAKVWTYSETMPAQNYMIKIDLAAWLPGLGWATGYAGATGQLQVAEVQAYSA